MQDPDSPHLVALAYRERRRLGIPSFHCPEPARLLIIINL